MSAIVRPVDFDVLVIGGGAAGLYTALCAPADWRIGLVTKDTLSLSASDWAQGGIAAAMDPNDSVLLHVEDTLKAGAGLCDRSAVEHLAATAATCIQHLVDLGVAFDRHNDHLALTLEAAHSRHRVLHAADTTGRAIVSILAQRVLRRPNITVFEQGYALDLWLTASHACQGVVLVHGGQIRWLKAQATVLATGGGGQVYAYTTNPPASTGDGIAMAWRAGARLRDLEFVQFHPTALRYPDAPPFLISEAVRGEGAYLVDDMGHRFVKDYDPAGELAPRDVVSRAIFQHLQTTGQERVWLDLRPIDRERLNYRFPNILRKCRRWGIDPEVEPIPVAPAAHYWMGGIETDLLSQTTIAGLYAVGENASTGVHGANRLASNSLLECLVYGAQIQKFPLVPMASSQATVDGEIHSGELASMLSQMVASDRWQDWNYQRQSLAHLVWESAGICRCQEQLQQAISQVESWRDRWQASPITQVLHTLTPGQTIALPDGKTSLQQLRNWAELNNLLDVAWLILKSAAFRTESRGGHFRSDYPHPDAAWQVHTLVQHHTWTRSDPLVNSQ